MTQTSQDESWTRHMGDRVFTLVTQAARQLLRDLPVVHWRYCGPEETLRFYPLGLHEAGRVKATLPEVIALDTDWRFLQSLRQELMV